MPAPRVIAPRALATRRASATKASKTAERSVSTAPRSGPKDWRCLMQVAGKLRRVLNAPRRTPHRCS